MFSRIVPASSEGYIILCFVLSAWALFPSSFYSINLLYVVIIYAIHFGVQSINRLSHPLEFFVCIEMRTEQIR